MGGRCRRRCGRRTWSRSMPTRRAGSSSRAFACGMNGREYCRLPIVRETLPGGPSYDTIDLGTSPGDEFRPGQGAGRPSVPDGRQPRPQRRQPLCPGTARERPWRAGAVGEYRRPGRVHHFLAGRHDPDPQPDQLVRGAAPRPRRTVAAGDDQGRRTRWREPPTVEPHIERPGPAEFRDPLVRRELQKAAVWFGLALAIAGVIVLAQPLLLIVGGMIFAVFLDGGTRLLGRVPADSARLAAAADDPARLRLHRLGVLVRRARPSPPRRKRCGSSSPPSSTA